MATESHPVVHPSTRRPGTRRRSMASLACSLAALVTLGACGSDDEQVAAAVCDAAVGYGMAFAAAPQDPAEITAFARDRLMPIGDVFERNLSGEAKTAATRLRAAFAAVYDTGDPSGLEAPDVVQAREVVGKAVHDGCALRSVDVRAKEYVYLGVPKTLPAGRVSFALKNEGVEDHEMVLMRRTGDASRPLDEVLALPEEEAQAELAFTGVAFGAPRTTNYVAVDLEPGTYALICFIPQGEDGPPHFVGGMKETIVVR